VVVPTDFQPVGRVQVAGATRGTPAMGLSGAATVCQGAGRGCVAMFAQTVPGDGVNQERQFLRGFASVAAEADGFGIFLDHGRFQRRSTVPGDHFPMYGEYSITH